MNINIIRYHWFNNHSDCTITQSVLIDCDSFHQTVETTNISNKDEPQFADSYENVVKGLKSISYTTPTGIIKKIDFSNYISSMTFYKLTDDKELRYSVLFDFDETQQLGFFVMSTDEDPNVSFEISIS